MPQHIIGVDIGGTTVKLAVVRAGAATGEQILHTSTIDTRPQDPGEQTAARIGQAVKILAGAAKVERIDGVGVGCPGLVDNVHRLIVVSANLPGFKNLPLGDLLEKEIGAAVALQNDANAAALGEFEFGRAGKGCRNMVLLTLGTGVGGGVICDGKLLVGADNAAAELGHVKVEFGPAAFPCGCGHKGCIEAYAGMGGIARTARAVLADAPSTTLSPNEITTKVITQSAAAGDRSALKILHRTGEYLGRAIASFVEIFNPEKVILAGGASRATPYLLPGIHQAMVENCSFAATRDRAKVQATAIPDDINVLGAAAVFLHR